jgi:hypothetical protein
MAYIVSRLGGTASSGVQGDVVGVLANIGGGLGKAVWYAKDKFPKLETALKAKGPTPTPTAIIDVAMIAITIIDQLNGQLPPNQGGEFNTGRLEFELVESKLETAAPERGKWEGDAAEAYAARNAELLLLAQKMRDLDKRIEAILKTHALKVKAAHDCCSMTMLVLVAAQAIAMILWAAPAAGPEASVIFQFITVAAAGAVVMGYELGALDSAITQATKLNGLAMDYGHVGRQARRSAVFKTIEVASAEKSYAPSFDDITVDKSGTSSSSGMPTISSLVADAVNEGALPNRDGVLDAFVAHQIPTAGASSRTDTPGLTPPTPPQPALSGQAAQPWQQTNLANHKPGQAQPPASATQRATAAPAKETAPDEATLAGDVESAGAGAAPSAAAAERAPVEVTVADPDQAREHDPVERMT